METDWCPMCEMHSITRGLCWKCGRDFRTGHVYRKRRPEASISLPTVRELLPNRLTKVRRALNDDRDHKRGFGHRG